MQIKNRSEVLFLYDIRDANPNGDPDENKPRIDEETEVNIVTDVRLKRTIRDYLQRYKNKPIWLIEEIKGDGMRKTREEKLLEAEVTSREDARKLLEKYLDLRLFGATIAGKGEDGSKGEKVFTWTGPVQFKFGRSLHSVEPILIKGTSVLPTTKMKAGGAFTEAWVLPYSLICFYGIINENNAVDTKLTEDDVNELMDAIWNGTKNLITRSKFGQVPRLLIKITYEETNYHIGDLDKKIKLLDTERKSVDGDGKKGKTIRSIEELELDLTGLVDSMKQRINKIESISVEVNDEVSFMLYDKNIKGKHLIEALRDIRELRDKIKELKVDK